MNACDRETFAGLLTATMEVYNAQLGAAAMGIWWEALSSFALSDVRAALSAHVTTPTSGRFAPKPADIIGALESRDGRPNADEAWAYTPRSEEDTVVWTEEAKAAFFEAAYHLVVSGDRIAARMAFKGAYDRQVSTARANRRPVRWIVSPGHDLMGRETVLLDAAERGLITIDYANTLLPHNESPSPRLLGLLEQTNRKLTAAPPSPRPTPLPEKQAERDIHVDECQT